MKKSYLLFIILILPFCTYSQKLKSISPDSAIAGQSLDMIITGSGTHFIQAGDVSITFAFSQGGRTPANFFYFLNDSSLLANVRIPVITPTGNYDVFVYNSLDDTLKISFHITGRPFPMVTSVAPFNANAGETINITIKGVNTTFKQNTTFVALKTLPYGPDMANFVNVLNDTVLEANITLSPKTYTGNYAVLVYTADDGELEYPGFQVQGVTPPVLNFISPASGKPGDTLTVSIAGAYTHFIKDETIVHFEFDGFNKTFASSVNVTSDTSLEATIAIPSETKRGNYTVFVTDSIDGTVGFKDGFYVDRPLPSLDSITPSSGWSNGIARTVYIKGKHTHFVQDQTDVYFGFDSTGTFTGFVNVINDTLLTVDIAIPVQTKSGSYDVSVTDSFDGTFTLEDSFYVNEGFSPTEGYPSQTLDIIIKGLEVVTSPLELSDIRYLTFSSDSVISSKIMVNSITIIGDSSISIKVNITIPPNQPAGYYNVNLGIVDGGFLLYQAFYVKESVPTTTSYVVNPEAGIALYPNPANDVLTVKSQDLANSSGNVAVWAIYSIDGRLLMQQSGIKDKVEINISELAKGIYILEIKTGTKQERLKFIKE